MFLLNCLQTKSAPKNFFTPYSYEDKLNEYKKHNAKVRAKYYKLANQHKNKHKIHIVLTCPLQGDRYEILEYLTVIRSRFNKLIKNLKLYDLYYFQNIELGNNFDNPHLDFQIWLNKQDVKKVFKVYEKIIKSFFLENYLCTFNEFDKNISDREIFHYTVKEYSKKLSNKEIYAVGEARRKYRKVLGKRIRFYSHTRNEYSQKIYKTLYKNFGLSYDEADYILDNEIIKIGDNSRLLLNIEVIRKLKKLHLTNIFNKLKRVTQYVIKKLCSKGGLKKCIGWLSWIFGFR